MSPRTQIGLGNSQRRARRRGLFSAWMAASGFAVLASVSFVADLALTLPSAAAGQAEGLAELAPVQLLQSLIEAALAPEEDAD